MWVSVFISYGREREREREPSVRQRTITPSNTLINPVFGGITEIGLLNL